MNSFRKIKNEDLRNILILAPIVIIGFFSNIWIRPAGLMEARNFITAREMIENDNFIIPTLNGSLRFEKPPFPTWVTAFVMKITGNSTDEYILRIPSALTGILFIVFLYYFVKFMTKDSRKSFITAFVGSTTFMITKLACENSWDIYVYVFAFGTILFTIKGFQNKKIKEFIIGGIFLGISILSKGPIGIYGLIFPFFTAYTVVYGFSDIKQNIKNIFIMFITALVCLSVWVIPVYSCYPDIFLGVMKKEQGTWSHSHTESFIYYIDYFIYMGIWILFSILTLVKKWSKKRSDDKNFSKFIFIWNILVIILLSFIKMKKKRYGLPIYFTSIMGVGIICTYYWNRTWEEIKKSDKFLIVCQGMFIIIISFTIPIIVFFKGYISGTVQWQYMIILLLIFFPLGYFIYISLFFSRKNEKVLKRIILGSGFLMFMINLTVNSYFDRNFIRDVKTIENYPKIKMFQKNPCLLEIYSDNYEIEDVWRVGKKIINYEKEIKLPEKFIFFGEIPEELLEEYKIFKREIYLKEDGTTTEINYLKKLITEEEKL